MCGENSTGGELFLVPKKSCLEKAACDGNMGDPKTPESLEKTLRSIEDLPFDKLSSEVEGLLKSQYRTDGTGQSILQVFERYLVCVFQVKREIQRLGRNEFSNESILSIESKVFHEYFPMISVQEKVDVASRILRARVLYELEPSTVMSLLEQGVDVSRTEDCFREGLLIWEGTWLHQLVSRGFALRREWFADADSVCICASEHVKESILDHALRAETSWNVKIYNIVLSIAMGCNLLNADIDVEFLPLLSWSVQNVILTQQFALSQLCKKLPNDLVSLVAWYYSSDLTEIIKVLEIAKQNL